MNAGVLKDIIKTIGQKPDNVSNGIQEARVRNRSFLFTTEKKGKQNAFVMSKMDMCFGMKLGGVIGCIHRYSIIARIIIISS